MQLFQKAIVKNLFVMWFIQHIPFLIILFFHLFFSFFVCSVKWLYSLLKQLRILYFLTELQSVTAVCSYILNAIGFFHATFLKPAVITNQVLRYLTYGLEANWLKFFILMPIMLNVVSALSDLLFIRFLISFEDLAIFIFFLIQALMNLIQIGGAFF